MRCLSAAADRHDRQLKTSNFQLPTSNLQPNFQLKTISPLPFDSALFDYPVGKAEIDQDWNESQFLIEAKNYQLVYIFSVEPLSVRNAQIQKIETKFVFEKKLTGNQEADSGISRFEGKLNSTLESLAYQSGAFSRFKIDSRLKSGEFKKLYKLWIHKSLEDGEVLVGDGNSGFVTCSVKSDLAQIGLIAVEVRQRGQRWGQRLIQAAENFAFAKGAKIMRISTQEANQPACSLYSKLGYEVVERVIVWHYWKSRE